MANFFLEFCITALQPKALENCFSYKFRKPRMCKRKRYFFYKRALETLPLSIPCRFHLSSTFVRIIFHTFPSTIYHVPHRTLRVMLAKNGSVIAFVNLCKFKQRFENPFLVAEPAIFNTACAEYPYHDKFLRAMVKDRSIDFCGSR